MKITAIFWFSTLQLPKLSPLTSLEEKQVLILHNSLYCTILFAALSPKTVASVTATSRFFLMAVSISPILFNRPLSLELLVLSDTLCKLVPKYLEYLWFFFLFFWDWQCHSPCYSSSFDFLKIFLEGNDWHVSTQFCFNIFAFFLKWPGSFLALSRFLVIYWNKSTWVR